MDNIIENENSSDYVCGECGASVTITDKVCPKCGADVSVIVENIQDKQDKQLEITNKDKTKYPALNVISAVYKFLAWLSAFISLLTSVIFLINDGVKTISIISIVIGVILFISFLAISEIIRLFIDIERNTRTFSIHENETNESKE